MPVADIITSTLTIAGFVGLPTLFLVGFFRGSHRCCTCLSEWNFFEAGSDSVAPLLLVLVFGIGLLSAL